MAINNNRELIGEIVYEGKGELSSEVYVEVMLGNNYTEDCQIEYIRLNSLNETILTVDVSDEVSRLLRKREEEVRAEYEND